MSPGTTANSSSSLQPGCSQSTFHCLMHSKDTEAAAVGSSTVRPSTPVGCIITPALQLCCCCCRRLFRCCRRPMSSKGPTGGSGVTRPSVILWYTRVESEATAHSSTGKPRSSTRRTLHIRDSEEFRGIQCVR